MQSEAFITDLELATLRSQQAQAAGTDKLELLVATSGYLSQRNTPLALAQAKTALRQLAAAELDEPLRKRHAARLGLVFGEAHWLHHELDAAEREAAQALATFELLGDQQGASDAHYLSGRILHLRGQRAARNTAFAAAAASAARGGDSVREGIVVAAQAYREAFEDEAAAPVQGHASLEAWAGSSVTALRSTANDALGAIALRAGDFRRGIACFLKATAGYRMIGERRGLMAASSNVSRSFASLNEPESAWAWAQQELELARACAWPLPLASSLLHAGWRLHETGKLDAGRALLVEARALLERLESAELVACAVQCVCAAEPEPEPEPDWLGRHDQTVAATFGALRFAQSAGNVHPHCSCTPAIGTAETGRLAPAAPGSTALCSVRHGLDARLAVAGATEGHTPPAALLAELASAHADAGRFEAAYAYTLQAAEVHERECNRVATNRAAALELRHDVDRAQALAEHNAQHALEQLRRAEILAGNNETLARLATVGQQITAQLETQEVFKVLSQHVHGLLDAASFSICLLDDAGSNLSRAFGMESGRPMSACSIAIDDPQAHLALCARTRAEVSIDGFTDAVNARVEPGMLKMTSALFAPLVAEGRLLGVMTLQSLRPCAYGARERLIFRSLCAYGAIALANADAYRRLATVLADLDRAQRELVHRNDEQARMNVERDEMLAFLAHDLRAPLAALISMMKQAPATAVSTEASRFATRALAMTDRFLEIARLHRMQPESLDTLEIAGVVDDACDTFAHRAAEEGKRLTLTLACGAIIRGHRESLMRALCNLIDNALRVCPPGGQVSVGLAMRPEGVEVQVTDTGPGMSPAVRMALQPVGAVVLGNGRLGLAIVAEVARVHGARVNVATSPAGTCVGLLFRLAGPEDHKVCA